MQKCTREASASAPISAWGWPIKYNPYHISTERLEQMRQEVDEIADKALIAMNMDSEKLLSIASSLSLQPSGASTPELDPDVERFISHVTKTPSWLDWNLIEHGQLFFYKNVTVSAMALLYFSLIGGFSSPKIVKVLDSTKYLTQGRDKTWRRLNETFEMVIDCLESTDSLKVGGKGWLSVLRVRLLHSKVRLMILSRRSSSDGSSSSGCPFNCFDSVPSVSSFSQSSWDSQEYGLPINQEDMTATLLSFSINVIQSVKNIGAPLLYEEELAYLHLWRLIGYYIGVDEGNNPCDSVVRASGAIESVVLHLLHPDNRSQEVADHVLESVSNRSPLFWSKACHSQVARAFLGDPLADALGIKYIVWSHLYVLVLLFFVRCFAFFVTPYIYRSEKYVQKCKLMLRKQISMALSPLSK